MLHKGLGALSAIIFSFTLFAISTAAATPEVELHFLNHDLSIRGPFAGFTSDAYVIRLADGLLHVPAVLVECSGTACASAVLPRTNG
ncbi:MAG: hypothetical protein AAF801_00605 [Pseudomonadota bacterium]